MNTDMFTKPPSPVRARHSWLIPALVVVAGLVVTAVVWLQTQTSSNAVARQRFEKLADRVRETIAGRIADQEQALEGIRGLYSASKSVERGELRSYVGTVNRLGEGELGYGFIRYVKRAEVDAFLQGTRADEAANFQLKTSGEHPDLFIIEFIEPLADNAAAEGFDIGQEQRRRQGAIRAVDENRAILTEKIELVQDAQKQPGFLLLLPIYKKGTSLVTPGQRWYGLLGWTYAPLRIDNLLDGISEMTGRQLDFEIFEAAGGRRNKLLFDSDGHLAESKELFVHPSEFSARTFWEKMPLKIAGQDWEVHLSTRPEFDRENSTRSDWAVLGVGLVISLLAGGMTVSLRLGRQRAVALAEQMTLELREENTRREQVSRTLRQVSQFQEAMLNSAAHAIISVTTEGLIRSFNPAAERLLGYAEAEMVGKQTPAVLHDLEEVAARAKEFGTELGVKLEPGFDVLVIKSSRGLPNEHEWTYIRKDGTRVPVWLSVTALRDEAGRLTGYLGMAIDIAARKQGEEKLQMSEAFNRSILDSVSAEIAVLDREGNIIAVNESWRRFALENGTEPGKPVPHTDIGTNYLACCRTDVDRATRSDAGLAREGIQAVKDGKSSHFTFEYPCHSPREKRWFSLSVTPLGSDVQGVVISHTNVTQRKQAEAELIKARETAEQALHEVGFQKSALDQHAIVSVTDLAGRILYANDRFCAISGYSREELLGQNHRIVNSAHHPAPFWKEMWHTIARGDTWAGEICNRTKAGSVYWVKATIVPFRDARGNVEQYVAIRTDITEQKKREEELIVLREAAEAATQAKSSFLATMSHEIRTPMNGVLGFTNLLLDSALTTEQREYVHIIQNSGQNLMTVINDILDYSKVEAGKLDLETIPYDLEQGAAECLELLASRAAEKHLELALDYASDAPRQLIGDPGRVRQVLLNLIGNALKFTSTGHVLVSVTRVTSLAHQPDQTGVRVAVTDTGIGIPKDKQAALFNKFSQADSSTTRKFGGTGLGLAISKQLVELMGGQVGIESAPGAGSTFWFTLPGAKATTDTPLDHGNAPWKAARILIVDDTEINRRVLQCQLKNWGVEHEAVADGVEALARLRAAQVEGRPFQIALLDHFMPEMDGEELGSAIRREPGLNKLSLVMITSSAQRGESARYLEAGFSAYVTKPLARMAALGKALDLAWADHATRCGGKQTGTVRNTAPSAPMEMPATARATGIATTEHRVLVVEDTVVNQTLAKHLLSRLGCRVDLAANGLEAVQMTGQFDYDLVLMDCHMPEMDGFEATRAIRRREGERGKSAHLPIVALTAGAMQEERAECMDAGMDDFVTKPFTPHDLEQALARWSKGRRRLEA